MPNLNIVQTAKGIVDTKDILDRRFTTSILLNVWI
jgi:hypothetical protein